jgi:hypothetical protein
VQDGPEAGRTQVDAAGYQIAAAVSADAAQFERLLLDGLNGRVR